MLIGIDFGAKRAGTSVVAALGEQRSLELHRIPKGEDADTELEVIFEKLHPRVVAVDAPLSLPKAYHCNGEDYFFRQCDRHLQAMSPMFLGGLTARAITLARRWESSGCVVLETYPRVLGRAFPGYRPGQTQMGVVVAALAEELQIVPPPVSSWHDVDALCALATAVRFSTSRARAIGDPEEGLIWI